MLPVRALILAASLTAIAFAGCADESQHAVLASDNLDLATLAPGDAAAPDMAAPDLAAPADSGH